MVGAASRSASSPYLVHLATAGPATSIEGMVLEPVVRPPRRPAPPAPAAVGPPRRLPPAGRRRCSEPPGRSRRSAPRSSCSSGSSSCSASVAVLVLVAVRRAARRPASIAGLARCWRSSLFSVGLLPQALQRADSTHLAWVSCVPLALPARRGVRGAAPRARRVAHPPPGAGRRAVASRSRSCCVLPLLHRAHLRRLRRADASGTTGSRTRSSTRAGSSTTAGPTSREPRNELLPEVERDHGAGRPPVRRPGRPAQDALQRRVPLLPAPRPRCRPPATSRWTRASPTPRTRGLADELRVGRRRRSCRRSGTTGTSRTTPAWSGPTSRTRCSRDEFCLVDSYGEGLFGRGSTRSTDAAERP